MKEYWFIYQEATGGKMRIRSKRKPSEKAIPKRWGGWSLQEWNPDENRWVMPCFPLVTWGVLKKLEYVGKEEA